MKKNKDSKKLSDKVGKKELVIYQAKSGAIELRGDFHADTIWATQAQIAMAFDVDVRTINEHIGTIYKTQELSEKPTIRNFRIVQKEGAREIEREIKHYNLDMILSVGYRVNSKNATRFRQWATRVLKTHITEGYTINRVRITQNYDAFMKAVRDVRALLPANNMVSNADILELISAFADTWFSLNAYDKGEFATGKPTKKKVSLTAEKLYEHISLFKKELMEKGEASDVFAVTREHGSLEGIVGNVMQAFGGKDVYKSVEEKAAHLLYFIVKNHPFVDGNKRTGAYAFVWFLRMAGVLDISRITPVALTVITILVAESKPTDKDKMVNLVVMLVAGSWKGEK